MLEASSMAPFVKWALEAVVERVIVCETRENRWIARSEDKSDPRDAEQLGRRLSAMLGHTREYKRMLSLPGVGEVTAATLVAVIDDPHRFANKRRLWMVEAGIDPAMATRTIARNILAAALAIWKNGTSYRDAG